MEVFGVRSWPVNINFQVDISARNPHGGSSVVRSFHLRQRVLRRRSQHAMTSRRRFQFAIAFATSLLGHRILQRHALAGLQAASDFHLSAAAMSDHHAALAEIVAAFRALLDVNNVMSISGE